MPRHSTTGTLVVGASQAGVQLATSLRELGDTAPVTLLGAEAHAPYQRPPLSKEFLAGTGGHEGVAFRTGAWYADQRVDLVCGERVVDVELASSGPQGPAGSGRARTASGLELEFDRLALTVGARPRRLEVPGAQLPGVLYLRDLDDAVRLRSDLAGAERVVVVGGGFIGLEAAAAARGQGRTVTVVEAADRLVPRAVAPVVSEFYRRAHEARGTTVLLGATVAGFVPSGGGAGGRVAGVRLADGRELPADLVLVGIGVVPRTELAEQLGLVCDGGIVVDARARTSVPSVVAAGDCTVLPHPMTGIGRVRLESVPSAMAQAGVAAATLLGLSPDTRSVPWFWSTQGDLRLQIAGLSTGFDHHVVRGDPETEKFSVLYYREGELLAVDAMNSPMDYLVVRKALTQGTPIPAEAAADGDTPLKAALAAAQARAGGAVPVR